MYGFMFFVIGLVKNKTGKNEMIVYKIASVIKILREIGISYERIFLEMYEQERDQKQLELFYDIHVAVQELPIQDAMFPLLQKMPIAVAVVLIDKISRNDDGSAWGFVEREMKHKAFFKIDAFSKMLPFLSYIFILVLILISIIPIGMLSGKAMSLIG